MKYFTCAETAKFIRAALKKTFPSTSFQVLSKVYTGGASISVRWVDGPTEGEVNLIAGGFAGSHFDAMIDLKSPVSTIVNGEEVRYGTDYVFYNRGYSPEFLLRRATIEANRYGFPVPEVTVSYGCAYIEDDRSQCVGYRTSLVEIIYRKARRTRAVQQGA